MQEVGKSGEMSFGGPIVLFQDYLDTFKNGFCSIKGGGWRGTEVLIPSLRCSFVCVRDLWESTILVHPQLETERDL